MVNNGYQNISKKQSTGSNSQINKEELSRNSSSSMLDQISRLPGVTVNGNSIKIRGVNTLISSTDPLVLLDGIPYPATSVNSIDPNMVQNITVLKDAAETSLYGVRGGNGVILITTQRGGKTDQNNDQSESIKTNKDGSIQLNKAPITALLNKISLWYQLQVSYKGKSPEGHYSGHLTNDIPLKEMLYILESAGIRIKQEGNNIVISG
jgi:TonB-dependent SusC/RagA subfamily outer membrane receptor